MDPPLPPLPPIENANYGSVTVGAASATSSHSPNAINFSGSDDIFFEASQDEDLFTGELLSSGNPDDDGKITRAEYASVFNIDTNTDGYIYKA